MFLFLSNRSPPHLQNLHLITGMSHPKVRNSNLDVPTKAQKIIPYVEITYFTL